MNKLSVTTSNLISVLCAYCIYVGFFLLIDFQHTLWNCCQRRPINLSLSDCCQRRPIHIPLFYCFQHRPIHFSFFIVVSSTLFILLFLNIIFVGPFFWRCPIAGMVSYNAVYVVFFFHYVVLLSKSPYSFYL